MQVSVEQLEGLERRITVQVPADEIDQEIQTRLVDLSRKVRLDGFRPGKVPIKVVKRMYGLQVKQEVMSDKLQRSFQDAITQENLRPTGRPHIEPQKREDNGLAYQATFEVLPDFDVQGIDTLKVSRPSAEVSDADIDAMLDTLRKQRVNYQNVDRPSQDGDRIMVSFEGKIDGADFPGNKGDDVAIVLGEGRMLQGFESQLQGVTAGAEKDFDVGFPDDYHAEELAGKTATFHLSVSSVAEPVLPEVDEEFAKSYNVDDGTVEGLRKALRETMERELGEGIKSQVKQQIMDRLAEANQDIQVPRAMVDEEIDSLASQSRMPSQESEGEEEREKKRQIFGDQARRRVLLGLIMSHLVSANEIKVDNDRAFQHLMSLVSGYGEEEGKAMLQSYLRDPKAMESVQALALEEQVVDWLLERADIEEHHSTFDEIMKPTKPDAEIAS